MARLPNVAWKIAGAFVVITNAWVGCQAPQEGEDEPPLEKSAGPGSDWPDWKGGRKPDRDDMSSTSGGGSKPSSNSGGNEPPPSDMAASPHPSKGERPGEPATETPPRPQGDEAQPPSLGGAGGFGPRADGGTSSAAKDAGGVDTQPSPMPARDASIVAPRDGGVAADDGGVPSDGAVADDADAGDAAADGG